jgi:hypothetical protein
MGSRDSWIDTDELSSLGRQLLGEPGGAAPHLPENEADDGNPPADLIGRWKRQLADIRVRAEKSGLLGELVAAQAPPANETVPAAFVPPVDGTLVARMRAFERWLAEAVRPQASFGADDLGFPILGAEGDPPLVATALSLCRSWHATGSKAMGAPSAMASRALEGRGILSVFPLIEGETFRFVALVTSQAFGSEAAARISSAFRAAMALPPRV